MNAPIGWAFLKDRRRESVLNDTTLQHFLLNESVWSRAFEKQRNGSARRAVRGLTRLQRFTAFIQCIYEKSRVHYLFPILLLIAYSLLGGFIFYTIESPQEELLIQEKTRYINDERDTMLRIVFGIQHRTHVIQTLYKNNSYIVGLHTRAYRKFALNQLYKSVYWYTLSVYYLTEHETHKAQALRPKNPELLWSEHFETNFGRIHALRNYTEQLALRFWEIGVEPTGFDETKRRVDEAVLMFNEMTGLNNVLSPVWTFWNSMFLAVTTYTTIGYGNITAKTKFGKLAAMIYAVIGIPLVLMILHKLGRFFLQVLELLWDYLIRMLEMMSCLKPRVRPRLSGEERISEMPLILAIGVALCWMFLCAAIFLKFEKDWDYFKSFYFFFCSLTTIGYGDVTPTNSEDMFIIFGFIIVGLSLVSMCINVIQLKLEKLFEELLLMMMEEYSQQTGGTDQIKGKMGMLQMWKMWKKRKARQRPEREREQSAENNLKKMFPFVRRRERDAILERIHQRLRQVSKSTQTDFVHYDVAYQNVVCSEPWPDLFSYNVQEPVVCLGPVSISESAHHPLLLTQTERLSLCSSQHQINASSMSGSSQTTSCTSSSCTRRAQAVELVHGASRHSPTSSGSVHSAPAVSTRGVDFVEQFDPSRRWTFVETGKAPRGAPRGLVVPYMFTKNQAKTVHTTDMKRLIAEIDVRLKDCRAIVTPTPNLSREPSNHVSLEGSRAPSTTGSRVNV